MQGSRKGQLPVLAPVLVLVPFRLRRHRPKIKGLNGVEMVKSRREL